MSGCKCIAAVSTGLLLRVLLSSGSGAAPRETTMKKLVWLAVAMALALAPHHAAGQDETIRIAVEGNFPPFNYLDANGQLQGFDVEIATALCAEMNVQCTMVMQPWNEMIPGLDRGEYDAIVSSMSMSAERREQAAFTQRYYDSPSVLLTAKTSPLDDFTPAGLAGKTLGVTLATAQMAYAEHAFAASNIKVFPSSPELYKGLADGAVDAIFEDKLAAFDWLSNTKAGQCCEFRGPDIKDATYFGDGAGIALRKDNTALRERFDAALVAITENGTYNMINAKFFPFSIR
jgi:polar amino acid transport system substrate-binding protein